MPRFSVSTWSLHRLLGPRYGPDKDNPDQFVPDTDQPGALTLLEVPAQINQRGINTLEICHFHFPSLADSYLAELKAALTAANVEFFSLLIDAGDLTHPDEKQQAADFAWIRSWIEVAGKMGAAHARVIAGYAEIAPNGINPHDHPLVQHSAAQLRQLAAFGREHGVHILTENFHPLTRHPDHLLAILDLCEGEVGLCVDFGNYKGAGKYDDLATILPRADSTHAKAHFPQETVLDKDDFVRCLELAKAANFAGPYTLIFDDPGDEWAGLTEMQQIVAPYLAA